MRIAAISDIHGDYASLREIWRDIEERGLSEEPVLNAGDTVAYGPDTMQCIDFVRDVRRRIVSVSGNYDINAAMFPERVGKYEQKWGKARPDKLNALRSASEEMTADARQWLLALPRIERLEIGGVRFSVSHYAPVPGKLGLFADTADKCLEEVADQLGGEVDVVVVGHTHSPFCRSCGGVLFVNPGCIGRSYGMPTYAEIAVEPNSQLNARIITCRVLQR
jgi:putative phosphoesterase